MNGFGAARSSIMSVLSDCLVCVDADQCKPVVKEEEPLAPKADEKQCNNPLAGLANAVNAITNGVSNDESSNIPVAVPLTVNSKQAPPKAMVKPQVLTHVIEGFVIQEGTMASCVHSIARECRCNHYVVRGQVSYSLSLRTSNYSFNHPLCLSVGTVRGESRHHQHYESD